MEGEKFDWLAKALADEMAADSERIQFYMAYADGVPACRGVDPLSPAEREFASLWGRLHAAGLSGAACTPPCCLSVRRRPGGAAIAS